MMHQIFGRPKQERSPTSPRTLSKRSSIQGGPTTTIGNDNFHDLANEVGTKIRRPLSSQSVRRSQSYAAQDLIVRDAALQRPFPPQWQEELEQAKQRRQDEADQQRWHGPQNEGQLVLRSQQPDGNQAKKQKRREDQLENEIKHLRDELERQLKQMNKMQSDMYRAREENAVRLKKVEFEHKSEIDHVRQNAAQEMNKLQHMMQMELHEVINGGRTVEASLKAQSAELRHKLDLQAAAHEDSMASLHDHHKQELADRELEMRDNIDYLNKRHEEVIEKVHQQVRELNDVLLAQDLESFLPSMFSTAILPRQSDNQIKNQFVQIHRLIEDFSRTVWKAEPELWTDDVLQAACVQQTERSVKVALLQDMVWTVLYDYVFRSPFRMLGKIGRSLEEEWCRVHAPVKDTDSSKPDAWPAPSVLAERWRYMTLIGCHEALQAQISAQDPRAAVKLGWEQNQHDMINAVESEVYRVIDAEEAKSSQIKHICTQAARVWLRLAMHRFRIELQLMGSDSTASDKCLSFTTSATLQLTKSPLLRRHGNTEGNELETFTVLAGCSGDRLIIP